MQEHKDILKKYWGYDNFRPMQEDIIDSVACGKDTLGLLPTGGGKSITFQVPAMAMDGVCIVITPLIALMKDQVDNLLSKGIKAVAIYSGMSKEEIELAYNHTIYGDVKFLYISPERLSTEKFRNHLFNINIAFIAVDESHCISQWGYDFRPQYLQIAKVRELLPEVPILALTATATPEVVEDIQNKLLFKEHNVFKKSFYRQNLVYLVRETDNKSKYLKKILSTTKAGVIVYVRNRRKTKEISDYLKIEGFNCDYYHAGIDNKKKELKQDRWKSGECPIIVSTNAFGMGIDKPDVRVVIHMDLPDSLEAYFQEAGRAGRDEKRAYAVILYSKMDKSSLEQRLKNSFPKPDYVKRIYQAICNYFQIEEGEGKGMVCDFNISDFVKKFKFNAAEAYNSLKLLSYCGYLTLSDEVNNPSRIKFKVDRDTLYRFQETKKEEFDFFLKGVLRLYTGLFTKYTNIDEEYIAKKLNIDIEKCKEYFKKLNNLKIIRYIPRKQTPYIYFVEPRIPMSYVSLTKKVYKDRKDKYTKLINGMIQYASSDKHCRSKILLEYFGEENAKECGLCDVCQAQKENFISSKEFNILSENILSKITEKGIEYTTLIDSVDCSTFKSVEVLKWLVSIKKIKISNQKVFKQIQ